MEGLYLELGRFANNGHLGHSIVQTAYLKHRKTIAELLVGAVVNAGPLDRTALYAATNPSEHVDEQIMAVAAICNHPGVHHDMYFNQIAEKERASGLPEHLLITNQYKVNTD